MESTPRSSTQQAAYVPGILPRDAALLRGRTQADYGSPHHHLTLAGATLVFFGYPKTPEQLDTLRRRWRFTPTQPGDIRLPEVGRTVVAEDGSFQVVLDRPEKLLLVAISVERFAYAPATGRRAFGLLGAAAPDWQPQEGQPAAARMDIALSQMHFCSILEELDLWLVAGRVTDCATGEVGLAGGKVEAFDRDILQDDPLGSTTTDAGGNFWIFFQSNAFKAVPVLPPPFDAIQPHELFGGPDVYFRVYHGATTVLQEPPATGRTPGREDVERCSYHELCVQAPVWTPQTLTLWSRIGNYLVPDGGGLHDFDSDGLTATGKQAFTGSLDFNGQLSQQYLGEAVSFRFAYAEWTSLSTPPAYPADYQPVLGSHLNLNAPYGSIYTFVGPHPWSFSLTPVLPAPDADGWIAVSQDPNFVRDVARLVQVRTETLVPAVAGAGMEGEAGAGSPVPVGPLRDRPRKFSFVLEIRTASHSAHQAVPVPIHVNNSAAYLHFELTELQSNACAAIPDSGGSITVHPAYTVAHPYLSSYRVAVQRQGGTELEVVNEGYAAHGPLWTDADGVFATPSAVYTDVQPCSYRATIVANRRLTNGYGGVGHQSRLRTFCVD